MFKLAPSPTFDLPLELSGPGDTQAGKLQLVGKYLGKAALQDWIKAAKDHEHDVDWLLTVITGWKEVADAEGQPLAFSRDSFDRLLDTYPRSSQEIFDAYVAALVGARRKN
jgi:hypothetical protein